MPEMPGGPDSGDAGFRAANARLRELLEERNARIAEQDAEIVALREQLAALQSQVADLAARAKSNSRNSSKPASWDGLAKPAPKSLRGKSGRKPGRPKGQPGVTMELSDHPDKKVRHRPARCGCCGKSLKNAPVTGMERRQVIDIPPVRPVTTEHQLLTLLCGCGCETKAAAPDGITAPVRYGPRIMGTGIYLWHGQFLSRDRACQALSEMFGCAPAPGALASAARKTAGFLPSFTGIAVHDAWAPCDSFDGVAGHALCGARVLRELTAVTGTGTDLDKTWAQQAIDALLALDEAAGAARKAGKTAIDPELRDKHEDWYRKAAETGIALNAARNGKLQQKRHALATRMSSREGDYLRFAHDLRVPFSNNAAEQSIRMCKLRINRSRRSRGYPARACNVTERDHQP